MGWTIVKELEKALSVLKVSVKLVPGDGAIVNQLAARKNVISPVRESDSIHYPIDSAILFDETEEMMKF